jgi:hypothetical protein
VITALNDVEWPTVVVALAGSFGLSAIVAAIFPTRPRRTRSNSEQ